MVADGGCLAVNKGGDTLRASSREENCIWKTKKRSLEEEKSRKIGGKTARIGVKGAGEKRSTVRVSACQPSTKTEGNSGFLSYFLP